MATVSTLRTLLDRLGPLATKDREERRERLMQEAPEFSALSFFDSREVVATKIIAYLLNPNSGHGQGDYFLRAFLKELGKDLPTQGLRSVVVAREARCYPLNKRRIDILIRFKADRDFVIAVESKSHWASDGKNQIGDYVTYLREMHSGPGTYLFYLKDGKPPDKKSVSSGEWRNTKKGVICHPHCFDKLMLAWLVECSKCTSKKLRTFIEDFQVFLKLGRSKTVITSRKARAEVLRIIGSGATQDVHAEELGAVIEIYRLHDDIWKKALEVCAGRVSKQLRNLLKKRHKGAEDWVNRYRVERNETGAYSGKSDLEFRVWKKSWADADGDPLISVVLATEISNGFTRFDTYVRKSDDFSPPRSNQFNDKGILILGPGKREYLKHFRSDGISDMRSADSVTRLLTPQGAEEITNWILGFIDDYSDKMDACFK